MSNTKQPGINVILTGATGMAGEGVLFECLQSPVVSRVLVINRKPCGTAHPKLKEIIHEDFFNFEPIEHELTGYDACFFCLGVSSVGMKEPAYYNLTYTLTLHVAQTLATLNPNMQFCYISGAGTDSSEKGRSMWARVKGKTENDLQKLPFKKVFAFRPGGMQSHKGLNNTLGYYKYFKWLFPILKQIAPNTVSTLRELGLAMISAVTQGYNKEIIEVSDIHTLAKEFN